MIEIPKRMYIPYGPLLTSFLSVRSWVEESISLRLRIKFPSVRCSEKPKYLPARWTFVGAIKRSARSFMQRARARTKHLSIWSEIEQISFFFTVTSFTLSQHSRLLESFVHWRTRRQTHWSTNSGHAVPRTILLIERRIRFGYIFL